MFSIFAISWRFVSGLKFVPKILARPQNLNPHSLQKFTACLQSVAQLLECPVCLDVVRPPAWQCCHGHVLCGPCRGRSQRCPVCRVSFGARGRCLIADKLFTLLAETFPCESEWWALRAFTTLYIGL